MLLLANLFWGLSFPTIKALTQVHAALLPGSGNWFVASMTMAPRFLVAVLLLGLLLGRRIAATTRLELAQGLRLGFFAGLGMLLQNDGLQFTAASTSAFLTQFYAILIPVWLALRRRQNPGWRVWVCCLLVLAGSAVLGHFDWKQLSLGRGELETLLSSFFFMGQILALDEPRFAGNRPERVSFVMLVLLMVLSWALAFCVTPSAGALWVFWSQPAWVGMTLVLAIFCTLGAFMLMNAWQPHISSTEAGLIYCFEPIFGTIASFCLPAVYSALAGIHYGNEALTWSLLLGGGLVTAANVLLQLKPKVS
jgi:drug/metabolite transporter (DMT)-like permease